MRFRSVAACACLVSAMGCNGSGGGGVLQTQQGSSVKDLMAARKLTEKDVTAAL